jgi:hypothetical protein
MVGQAEADGVADRLAKTVTTSAAAFAAIATVAGTFAAATGGLERMFRNLFWPSLVAALLTGLAAILGLAVAPLRTGRSVAAQHWRIQWIAIATSLLVLGLIVAAATAAKSTSIKDQPGITGSITMDKGVVFKGTIKATGLRSGDIAHIRTFAYYATSEQDGDWVYMAEVGADNTGSLNVQIEKPLEAGAYSGILVTAWTGDNSPDCEEVKAEATKAINKGCMYLPLPRRAIRPQLTTAWKGGTASSRLEVKVKQPDMKASSGVVLQITGKRKTAKLLYKGFLVPDTAGEVNATISVPISAANVDDICITAIPSTKPEAEQKPANSCTAPPEGTLVHLTVPSAFIKKSSEPFVG